MRLDRVLIATWFACMIAVGVVATTQDSTTVVCILWIDITGDTGWVTEDELIEPAPVVSCGIFIKEDEENLWLAMDMSAEEGEETIYNSTGVFPKGVIQERIEVEIDLE
jgi:hypothetical protein